MEYAAHADNTWGLLHRLADAQTGWCTDWLMHRLAGSSKAPSCLTFIGTMPWHMVDTHCATAVSGLLAAYTACLSLVCSSYSLI